MRVKERLKPKRIVQKIKFFDSKDLAKILGLSIISVCQYLREGKIPGAIKLGRKWYISSKNLDRWLTQSYMFTKSEAQVIETKVIENIEANLEKIRTRQEELKRDSAPKQAIEQLQKRLEGIEKSLEDYKKEFQKV